EEQGSIFERFYRVEKSRNKEGGGSGLGLSICKEIIDLHGGEIGVESDGYSGSTFWFRIPIESSKEER
ncbi:ATP-binding protein, partial [Micrococcus sp. SIMBA_144]